MVFSCTPQELVSHVLEHVTFSGYEGVSVADMWHECSVKLGADLDDFEKQIVWQWLFLEDKGLLLWKENEALAVQKSYTSMLVVYGTEESLRVLPTSETQWKYLTGKDNPKKLKTQLGEFPFQLLCEIARHGRNGIFASDLSKATGQDPRSLTLRLRKLEELDLIEKKNVYNQASGQHTSLCIHKKFAGDVEFAPLDFSDDLKTSRDAHKLRQLIMDKIKNADNGLRSLSDLKHELSLGNNISTSKFFRGIVESLCKKGYLEKVNVKSGDAVSLIYCVKFVMDIPHGSSDNIVDYLDFVDTSEDPKDLDDDESEVLPRFNQFFPISNQLYKRIVSENLKSPTSMDVSRELTGSSDFRPLVRMLDTLTTFVKDHNSLKRLKNYDDPYEGLAITRVYDFEGKFKFYRYFGEKGATILDLSKTKPNSSSIAQLTKKLYVSIGKIKANDQLLGKKRKIETAEPKPRASKRVKTKVSESRASPNLAEQSTDTQPSPVTIRPALPTVPDFKRTSSTASSSPVVSIKSNKRREELLTIIKEFGGVTYTSASLRRELDQRLGNKTSTDMKTIIRDIAHLVHFGSLEAREIKTVRSGQKITRKLLILTDPALRPNEEKINEVQKHCEADDGKRVTITTADKKVIEADVTLYSARMNEPKKIKKRLDNLNSTIKSSKKKVSEPGLEIKLEPVDHIIDSSSAGTEDTKDPLSMMASSRSNGNRRPTRRKQPKAASTSASDVFRKTRVLKFDKTDAALLFKVVVISRAFKRSMIDFDHLTKFFDDISGRELKQKWTTIRKRIGGHAAVAKGIETFENIVRNAIIHKQIDATPFEPLDFDFFLQLWEESQIANFVETAKPFYFDAEDNKDHYTILETNEPQSSLYDQLENNSMRQKEHIIANHVFYQEDKKIIVDAEEESIKTALRAICATDEASFSSLAVKNVLQEQGDSKVQTVLLKMIKDKDIAYNNPQASETEKNFVLTERFDSSLINPDGFPKLVKSASTFYDSLKSLCEVDKAMILSQGVKDGHMIALLNTVSDYKSSVIHVSRPYTFSGYESRLIDKAKLSCDIIVKGLLKEDQLVKVPVPQGKACSHVWIDLKDDVNANMWIRIISSFLSFILYRPGVTDYDLFNQFKSALTYNDIKSVLQWLKESKCLREGEFNDYWVDNEWYCILG